MTGRASHWRTGCTALSALLALFGLVAVAGCGKAPESGPDLDVYVVPALASDHLDLVLDGHITDPDEVGHALPIAWVPPLWLVDEGTAVKRGQKLATLDTDILDLWSQDPLRQIIEQRAQLLDQRLKTASDLATLEDQQADLEADLGATEAAMVTADIQDARALDIARIGAAAAVREAAEAAARAAKFHELAAAGHASAVAVADADDRATEAAAAVGPAQARLTMADGDHNGLLRASLAIARKRLLAELGRPESATGAAPADLSASSEAGVAADLAAVRAVQEKQETLGSEGLANLERDQKKRQDVIDHPQIDAQGTGFVRFRDSSVRPGAKLGAASFIFVLDPGDLVARFVLPERWRGLVRAAAPDDPSSGHAEITIGGLGGTRIPGQVTALAAAAIGDHGGRGFTCTVHLARPDPGLRAGMGLSCALALPLGAALATVPTWCIGDLRHPRVQLDGGKWQDLDGYSAGATFVVLSGLAPGARIRLPAAAPAAGGMRVTGVIEAMESAPVRLSSGGWELLEMVPDGTLVHRGEPIAKLSKSNDWKDLAGFQFADTYGAAQANADLAIARLNAERDRAHALLAWQEAAADAAKARIDVLTLRNRDDSAVVADAQADLIKATVAAGAAARAAAAASDPASALGMARNSILSAQVEAQATDLARKRAQLALVGQQRGVDLLALEDAEAAWHDAVDAAGDARAAYSTAVVAADAALARAHLAWRDALERHRRDREAAADAVVVAPRDGRVYQRLIDGERPLEIGMEVDTAEPFTMPVGPGRMFTVEVPARFYGRFAVAQQIPCVVPSLGHGTINGRVLRVAAWFHAPSMPSLRGAAPTAALGTEKVFGLTVALDLDAAQGERVPPGATASIDL